MARELEKLANTFRRSWMSSRTCVEHLDEERVRRQNALVLDKPDATPAMEGWRDDQGPFAFEDLVRLATAGLAADPTARGHQRVVGVTLACALIAELLASVFNEGRRAGAAFELSHDERRAERQQALVVLRNAVCHPGYLSEPVNNASNVDALARLLPEEQDALRRELLRDRRVLRSPALAR